MEPNWDEATQTGKPERARAWATLESMWKKVRKFRRKRRCYCPGTVDGEPEGFD
jgi:hypothetical protein